MPMMTLKQLEKITITNEAKKSVLELVKNNRLGTYPFAQNLRELAEAVAYNIDAIDWHIFFGEENDGKDRNVLFKEWRATDRENSDQQYFKRICEFLHVVPPSWSLLRKVGEKTADKAYVKLMLRAEKAKREAMVDPTAAYFLEAIDGGDKYIATRWIPDKEQKDIGKFTRSIIAENDSQLHLDGHHV